jgi:DNA modification methylase
MTLNTKNKQLIAIDFKWADKIIWKEESTKANKISLMLEMRSYWKWLSKIDRELPTILLEILDDPIP